MRDLFGATPSQTPRGTIDRTIGQGNGRFLGMVANGTPRAELERLWKAGEFPDLNPTLAQNALRERGA